VRFVRLWVFFAVAWFPAAAHAGPVYDFLSQSLVHVSDRPIPAGNYLPTDTITGFVELSAALGVSMPLADVTATVLDYPFSDDRGAINPGNADSFSLSLGTDAFGVIDAFEGFIFYERILTIRAHKPTPIFSTAFWAMARSWRSARQPLAEFVKISLRTALLVSKWRLEVPRYVDSSHRSPAAGHPLSGIGNSGIAGSA